MIIILLCNMFSNIIKNIKVTKFNIVFYLGILLLFISLQYHVEFIEIKNLFGLSIGLIIFGLVIVLGHRVDQVPTPRYVVSQEASFLDPVGIVVLTIGALIILWFFVKIILQVL